MNEYVERDCPLCKGAGAVEYTQYDPDTKLWESGIRLCSFYSGVVKIKIETRNEK